MSPPLHLYKYRSLRQPLDRKAVKRALLNQELYFPVHTEFNDLLDCNLPVSPTTDPVACAAGLRELNPRMSDAEIDALVQHELSPARAQEIAANTRDGMYQALARVGILSLSAKPDDLLMWSYYADGHRGVCLQFAVRDGQLFGCDLTEVHYELQCPLLTVYDDLTMDWTRRYLSTKAKVWEHEEEWRIIWRKPGMNRFPPEDLSGVIVGAQISPQHRAQVVSWIADNASSPTLYEARTKSASFGVDIVQVEDADRSGHPTIG